jgi:hypothetical protein
MIVSQCISEVKEYLKARKEVLVNDNIIIMNNNEKKEERKESSSLALAALKILGNITEVPDEIGRKLMQVL